MVAEFEEFEFEGSALLNTVVTVHLKIEQLLRRQVRSKLERPDALITDQGPSFSSLVSIAEATGALPADVAKVLRAFNVIRNRYAHRLGYEASRVDADAFLVALRDMEDPIFVSFIPGSESELAKALGALTGWFHRKYGSPRAA